MSSNPILLVSWKSAESSRNRIGNEQRFNKKCENKSKSLNVNDFYSKRARKRKKKPNFKKDSSSRDYAGRMKSNQIHYVGNSDI